MTTVVPPAVPTSVPSAATEPLLDIRAFSVAIGGIDLVREVDLRVDTGEVVGLVGPNGAGKSTLLRAATGFLKATGTVQIAGRAMADYGRAELFRTVAVVQQMPEAPPTITVGDLVLLGRHPHLGLLRRESEADRVIARDAMTRAGCLIFAERELGTLSGGERRRAFIARALAQEPKLLLLDEPTAGLDADAQAQILELLRELARNGVGVLVVLHDLTFAAAYCDRLVLLSHGRIVASGTPAEVIAPEYLAQVYGPHVRVFPHPETGSPIVVPVRQIEAG